MSRFIQGVLSNNIKYLTVLKKKNVVDIVKHSK